MAKRPTETRMVTLEVAGLELREGTDGQPPKLVGHAAVFNQWTTISDWWGALWEESVAPGAFKKTIQEADVRALWNHDANVVLGRNKAGTLELGEDATGLLTTIYPPDNEWGRPVLEAVKRGDVSGMSIAFQVVRDEWERPDRKKEPRALPKRTIKEMKLFDVSPVTYPAFPQTDIAARDERPRNGQGERPEEGVLRAYGVLRGAAVGMPIEADERATLLAAVDILQRAAVAAAALTDEPGPDVTGDHSPTTEPGGDTCGGTRQDVAHSVEMCKRTLELLEMKLGMGGKG